MPEKTYKPTLLVLCKAVKAFVRRYQVQLKQNLPEGAYDALIAIVEAIETFIPILVADMEGIQP